jgi:transcriptional repressor NrdR
MRCPKCTGQEDKVIDSRSSREGASIRRRRECLDCGHRFTTYEEVEEKSLVVLKRDGRREDFSRDKLLNGVRKACQKRPVSDEAVQAMVDRIVAELQSHYDTEVPYVAIGEKVIQELRGLDAVAYVRFASVYRRFEEASDFLHAVQKLEVRHDTATYRLPGF